MTTAQTKSEQETKSVYHYQQMVGVDIAAQSFTASRLVLAKAEAAKTNLKWR